MSSDSEKDYFSILHAYPAGSPADALAHNSRHLPAHLPDPYISSIIMSVTMPGEL